MALYLFETASTTYSDVEMALGLISYRFPEIVVERVYTAHSGRGAVVWVCRAPNLTHMQRWAEAGRLRPRNLRQVDLTDPQTDGHPTTVLRVRACSHTIGSSHDSAATTERKEQLQ
jgi:hypothetical protein